MERSLRYKWEKSIFNMLIICIKKNIYEHTHTYVHQVALGDSTKPHNVGCFWWWGWRWKFSLYTFMLFEFWIMWMYYLFKKKPQMCHEILHCACIIKDILYIFDISANQELTLSGLFSSQMNFFFLNEIQLEISLGINFILFFKSTTVFHYFCVDFISTDKSKADRTTTYTS